VKLLFVIDNLSTGGAQRQMVNLGVGLHQLGHQIDFFCYAPGDLLAGPLRAADIPVRIVQKKSRFSPDVLFALRDQIHARGYDLLLSYMTTPNVYAILATRFLPRRPRIVISERLNDLPGKGTLMQEMSRQLYRLADHVVVNSHHQREDFVRRYRWMSGRISTIYNGVDVKLFHPPEHEPADEPFRLLSIASIALHKNGLCLLSALAVLDTEYGLCPYVSWAGQHVTDNPVRAAYIRKMDDAIAAQALGERWKWLYQQKDVIPLYHGHHALIHPSYLEGLPNVVCEALACGRPVIVSNVLDHPRLVQHGISGYLFEPQDAHDLARCIKRLHDMSADERHEMGQQGRRFAEQHLSLERLCHDYERLFEELLA
jgi:GalNAc-alpha-(1->4)-GalNAc-alpha-(1->3)-diNAcBac-PP-undecaprenol alpha-1,4-N-acetyl-D-galactosaminyltransferase